jgi:signal transduction histidine kinase
VAGKAADIVASIQRKEMQHVQTLPDSAGQFEVRTASAEDTPITEMRDRLEDYLWLDSHAGDTTGILLTTIVGSPPVMTRVNGELRLLQTYCDLLTSSIEAMATYISRDGAHRALGYIGHEIGTPFIIMAESAELITQNNMELAEQIREFYPALASDVLRTARSNHRLIGRQRDEIDRVMSVAPLLANMGSGELSMYVEEADIGSVFREARDRLQTETHGIQPSGSTAKGLGRRRFAIKITDSMSRLPIVACDEGLILQVAINLLRNAVKYSLPRHPPEPMIVTVSGRSIDDRMCAVTVDNWGFGIPEEVQSRIFLPFVRGQVEDRLKSLPGMGIGLYLVSTIMAAHGGSVSCRSVPTLDDPKRTEALEGWLTAFELRFRRDLPIGPRTAEIRSASSLGARQRGVDIRVGH